MKPAAHGVPLISILIVSLLCFSAAAVGETETETQTQTSTGGLSQQSVDFSLIPSPVTGSPNYTEGNGSAFLQVQGTFLSVHAQVRGMAPGASFMLVLTANGTAHSVANMTSSDDGELEAEAMVSLSPGSYSLGLQVLDTSTFASPTQVLVSSPASKQVVVTQGSGESTTQVTENQSVSTFQGGQTEDDDIRSALQSRFIPAVVQVGDTGSFVSLTDSNFSVSVGRYQGDGYEISISADNVTGPRVLLVNLTSSAARSLFSGQVVITLDGSRVEQASSFSQVLGARAGDPSRFVVVSTSTGFSLLISIPHFSYHAIAILPVLAQAGAALLVDLPALLLAVAAVSVVVMVAFARRTRFEA